VCAVPVSQQVFAYSQHLVEYCTSDLICREQSRKAQPCLSRFIWLRNANASCLKETCPAPSLSRLPRK